MRAIQFNGEKRALLFDVDVPSIGPGETLVRIDRAGICGSDIGIFTGRNKRARYPVIPGHEFVGFVERIEGDNPKGFKPGDRVMAVPTLSCGTCAPCVEGPRHLCSQIKFLGIQYDGGFAEFTRVPTHNLLPVSDSLDFGLAVLAEPIAVGIHALSLSNPGLNDDALVLGAGPIGIIMAMLAREAGCRVALGDPSAIRRAQAESFGFPVFDNSTVPAKTAAREFSLEGGFDTIFECAGHPSTIDYMIKAGSPGSDIVIVGTFKEPPPVDIFWMSRKEQRLLPSWTYRFSDCRASLDLLERRAEVFKRLVSHEFALEQAQEAMELVMKAENSLKVVLLVKDRE
ncbi:MAG: alcohol dehydrogenase catalytic domain-containing protein [Spirochaetes bacterium]|nr:alcohol dehydrogenase catalytic domain-containing protein [Spirochaetota bacterium]